MTTSVLPSLDASALGPLGAGGLEAILAKKGRMPPVSLIVKPLEQTGGGGGGGALGAASAVAAFAQGMLSPGIVLDRFLGYQFSSSILIPVDTFNFSFVAPDGPPLSDAIKEGDLATLSANDVTFATGIVDSTVIETDAEFGEKGTINGRDLLSQLEDQDAISLDSTPLWGNAMTVEQAVRALIQDTRITRVELREAPSGSFLFATEPGESKLAALQRFLEALNCLSWMGPDGTLIVGKPNMSQDRTGRIFLVKGKRQSNVLSMSVTRSSTSIPNAIVPIWAGQESTVDRVGTEQVLKNAAPGPSRLFKLGHRTPKTVVVSTPDASSAQGKADLNAFVARAAGGNLLQAYAKREIARRNVNEIVVQAVVPGHFNENGEPYVPDTVYHVEYDRGGVDENMYLYQVDYGLDSSRGQHSNLWFCRLGCIVADVRAPG